jgi:hypothetical protein
LDAAPAMHAEPLSDDVTTLDLEHAKNVTKHERDRLRMEKHRQTVYYDGTVIGKGLTHFYSEKDKLSGEMKLCAERVDPRRFYWDPSADSLAECRFVVYEPELDMSRIAEIFPEKAGEVKPSTKTDLGKPYSETRSRSNDELMYSTGTGMAVFEKDGQMHQKKADVAFVWVKSDELLEEVRAKVLKEERPGLRCLDCGVPMEEDAAEPAPMMDMGGIGDMMDGGPEMGMEPGMEDMAPPACPHCGSPNLQPITLPEEAENETVISRKYPYGRLIVTTGEVLLFDGPSPWELETVFPFAEYAFDPIPGDFMGVSDVDLLKSVSMVLDKNQAMLLDAQRLTSMGVFEYPIGAEGYSQLGTQPGQTVPVSPELIGMSRWITPNGYNDRLHSVLDEISMRDLQRISGISDVSQGMSPTAPTSGVEVQARQRAAATRIGQHMKAMSQYDTDCSNIIFQLMRQLYKGPRMFRYDMAMAPMLGQEMEAMGQAPSEFQAISLDVSMLPPGIAIRMTADPDDIEKDRLEGQNVLGVITNVFANPGILLSVAPYLDILLPSMGIKPQKAKELQTRVMTNLPMIQAAMMAQAALPTGNPPGQSDTTGPSSPPNSNSGGESA